MIGGNFSKKKMSKHQSPAAIKNLTRAFRSLQTNPCEYFSVSLIDDDLFRWRVTILGPRDTLYEDGFFPAELDFPDDYPNSPPTMKFLCPMFHPNIGKDGVVCISILHKPGRDQFDYEKESERWLPIHTVESIVISVISMLSDPNCESPLNVEANRVYMNDKEEYKRRVRKCVRRSIDYC